MNAPIEILLAVFNGENHLREQLDSLLSQTAQNWTLLIRDDGSSDGSSAIVAAYQRRFPAKIRVLDSEAGAGGALHNFSALLAASSADYLMLCDQDDVWLGDKIEVTFKKMLELERAHGHDCPLLVHTDMKVTDGNLKVLADSLWRYQKSDPERGRTLNRLLVQNCATGCSVMINRNLRDLALPIPQEAVMHDWWLALVAGAFGKVGYLAAPTMLYRQHDGNDTGAKKWSTVELGRRLFGAGRARLFLDERRLVVRRTQNQARAFSHRFAASLSPRVRTMLDIYSGLDGLCFLRRKYYIIKFGFFHTGIARNVARLILG